MVGGRRQAWRLLAWRFWDHRDRRESCCWKRDRLTLATQRLAPDPHHAWIGPNGAATSVTRTPGCSVAATAASFSSRDQRRRGSPLMICTPPPDSDWSKTASLNQSLAQEPQAAAQGKAGLAGCIPGKRRLAAANASPPDQLDLFSVGAPGLCTSKSPGTAALSRPAVGVSDPLVCAPPLPPMSQAPKPSVALAAEPKRRTWQPRRPGTDGRLLDVEAAARYLGLSASTLNKLRCRGGGPKFLKITRSAVRYDPTDLDAWLAARRRGSTSESS